MFRNNLHGASIFPDCCTIKAEFAKQEKLNVKTNNNRARDYTETEALLENNNNNDGEMKVAKNSNNSKY